MDWGWPAWPELCLVPSVGRRIPWCPSPWTGWLDGTLGPGSLISRGAVARFGPAVCTGKLRLTHFLCGNPSPVLLWPKASACLAQGQPTLCPRSLSPDKTPGLPTGKTSAGGPWFRSPLEPLGPCLEALWALSQVRGQQPRGFLLSHQLGWDKRPSLPSGRRW